MDLTPPPRQENHPVHQGDSLIHVGARQGDLHAVQTALDSGAAINAVNAAGATALLLAAEYGHLALCRHLIDRGADLEVRSRHGVTALYMAVHGGHRRIVRLLLKHGASVDISDRWGMPMLAWAAYNADAWTFQTLMARFSDRENHDECFRGVLQSAAGRGPRADLGIVQTLLDRGFDPYAKDEYGESAVGHWCNLGCSPAIRALLDARGITIDDLALDDRGSPA